MNATHRVRRDTPLTGIMLKIASVALFVGMQSFIKAAGQVPSGQIVFFRSFAAIFPVLLFLALRRELKPHVMRTSRLSGHILRGSVGVISMVLGFYALTRLPLPEAVTLNYAQPLLVVVFSALFLRETIRVYRWSAVLVGLAGVLVISWPKLTLLTTPGAMGNAEFLGVIAVLGSAALSAVAMILVRSLVHTEASATIVLWFSLSATVASLLTIPFGWQWLTPLQTLFLVCCGICGGVAQILMTESYRHAEASTVAPFEYTSMLLAIGVGYLAFGDRPSANVVVGGLIVVGAGIFIIWRERRLGLESRAARKVTPPQ